MTHGEEFGKVPGYRFKRKRRSLIIKNTAIIWGVVALLSWDSVFAQQPAPKTNESHKYRTIFTIVGGAGGFAAGVFAGLTVFDDAVNSDRKVWLTAVSSAAAGAVGGFFLGRALDKRKQKTTVTMLQYGGDYNPASTVRVVYAREALVNLPEILAMRGSPRPASQSRPCAPYAMACGKAPDIGRPKAASKAAVRADETTAAISEK